MLPGRQVPLWQVSPSLQGFPSSQGVPLVTALQVPVAVSHTWHCGQVTVTRPCWQVPLLQVSAVHLFPVSQGVPVSGVWTQLPVAGSQLSVVHSLLSLQSFSGPGVQTPAWQVSFSVHLLPSSHAVPLATGWQVPVAGLHFWHCGSGQVTVTGPC
jgi:hypothetical protein